MPLMSPFIALKCFCSVTMGKKSVKHGEVILGRVYNAVKHPRRSSECLRYPILDTPCITRQCLI